MESKQHSFTILMLPWLAHGHISPFLELAKSLSTKNFKVFFCSTPNNLTSIRNALETTSNGVSIHLIELEVPPLPDLPPEYHLTKNLPPNFEPKLREAFHMSQDNFSTIITSLKPDILIYDFLPSWPRVIASSLGIPAVHFATPGAATHSFFHHLLTDQQSPFPFDAMHFRDYELKEFQSVFMTEDRDRELTLYRLSTKIILMRTCRELEGKYLDCYSTMIQKKVVPVGPLIAPSITEQSHSKIMQWLSTKNRFSTLFISFGSENYMSKNQIIEMAKALELASYVNFIWVLRFPPHVEASIDEALPEGFLDRVKERGIIIQGWAPQATILGHPSIGAFASHCGMSSTIESAYLGVPVIGIPFRIDQPLNAKLLVEEGIGIEVKRGKNGHFTSEDVLDVLNKVFVQKTGEEMRLKAAVLSKKLKSEEDYAMNEVADQLRQICVEHKQHKAKTDSEISI